MQHKKNKVFIISGPSRVGKEVITKGLVRKRSLNLQKVITATSRPRRPGERPGKDFHFFTPAEFEQKIKEGFFLEWAVLRGGRYFGTPVKEFDKIHQKNKHVIMNIDVQGSKQIAKIRDDVVRIFIKPDNVKNVKERMQEAGFTEEQMKARLVDMKREMKEAKKYDYTVVNKEGELDQAIEEVAEIIKKEINSYNM